MYRKKCKYCGNEFLTKYSRQKCCSRACGNEEKKLNSNKPKEPEKPDALSETISKAKAAGMSYGKYVAMKYMERDKQ